jgi:nucleoside-diphosphate-sugar epimerase
VFRGTGTREDPSVAGQDWRGRKEAVAMRALVTGAAGFVGSHLVEHLHTAGWDVAGVDCFSDYYDVRQKRSNVAAIQSVTSEWLDIDLNFSDLTPLLDDVDVVFHQAGQPGVRSSWAEFDSYVAQNVMVTHRLLEAARGTSLRRFVYASSSSVYGNALSYPTREDTVPMPQSPYGVTKLAAEHLCGVYARNWDVPTVALRYFTVFGPRQRPDMAMHRLIEAALFGGTFPMYGTGDQIRDFTYVGDVVAANLAAATAEVQPGTVVNIAGGGATTLAQVIEVVERLTGKRVDLDRRPPQAGDVERTGGAVELARDLLGWTPQVPIEEGLERQVRWHLGRLSAQTAGV